MALHTGPGDLRKESNVKGKTTEERSPFENNLSTLPPPQKKKKIWIFGPMAKRKEVMFGLRQHISAQKSNQEINDLDECIRNTKQMK